MNALIDGLAMTSSVLFVGVERDDVDWLVSCVGGELPACSLSAHGTAAETVANSGATPGSLPILVIADIAAGTPSDQLAQLSSRPLLLLSDTPPRDLPKSVWFVLRRDFAPEHVKAIVSAALEAGRRERHAQGRVGARRCQRAFEQSLRLALQTDLLGAEAACVDAMRALLDVASANCLFFDAESGALWSELRVEQDERRALAGLVGYCARTRQAVRVESLGAERRWNAALDGGKEDDRLLAVPIEWLGEAHAVLVATRGRRAAPFADDEATLLENFAVLAAPILERLSREVCARESLAGQFGLGIFRSEALAARHWPRAGRVLRVAPANKGLIVSALVALATCVTVLLAFGRSATHTSGPAIIANAPGAPHALQVLAWLPIAQIRALSPGMVLRVELSESRYTFHDVVIASVERVGDATVAQNDIVGGSVVISEPSLLVRAPLAGRGFSAHAERRSYRAGMQGMAQVKLRSERVFDKLLAAVSRLVTS